MPHGLPPTHSTRCATCQTKVGAVTDAFSNHRSARAQALPQVWKTSPHKHLGRRCPGSLLAVSPGAVTHHEVQGSLVS